MGVPTENDSKVPVFRGSVTLPYSLALKDFAANGYNLALYPCPLGIGYVGVQLPGQFFDFINEFESHQIDKAFIYGLSIYRLADARMHDGQVFDPLQNLFHHVCLRVKRPHSSLEIVSVECAVMFAGNVEIMDEKIYLGVFFGESPPQPQNL